MDFIVLGTILGAIMMVAGAILRDLVPRRLGVGDDETLWVTVRDRRRLARLALVGSRLATIAGVTILSMTMALILIDPSDRVALTLIVGLSVVALVGTAGWVAWYRYQESTGAIQRRQLRAIAARPAPARETDIREQPSRPRNGTRTGGGDRPPGRPRPVMASSAQAAAMRRDPRRDDDRGRVDPEPPRRSGSAAPRGRAPARPDARDAAQTRSGPSSAVVDRVPPEPARDDARRRAASLPSRRSAPAGEGAAEPSRLPVRDPDR